jgi:hypothetical protein
VSFRYTSCLGQQWSYDMTVVRGDVDDDPHPERDIDDDLHAPCPDDQGSVAYEVELELMDWPDTASLGYAVESSFLKALHLIDFMEPDRALRVRPHITTC